MLLIGATSTRSVLVFVQESENSVLPLGVIVHVVDERGKGGGHKALGGHTMSLQTLAMISRSRASFHLTEYD